MSQVTGNTYICECTSPKKTPRLSTFCLPGALMETSKHQELSLAEDHPVAAASWWTTRRSGNTQKLKSFWTTDICKITIINKYKANIHNTVHLWDVLYLIRQWFYDTVIFWLPKLSTCLLITLPNVQDRVNYLRCPHNLISFETIFQATLWSLHSLIQSVDHYFHSWCLPFIITSIFITVICAHTWCFPTCV